MDKKNGLEFWILELKKCQMKNEYYFDLYGREFA